MLSRRLPLASLALALGLLQLSYVTGPTRQAGDRTGSPLNTTPQKCATCHNGGNYNPRTTVELVDGGGEVVPRYRAGEAYELRFTVEASGSPAGYGYQAVVLDEQLASAGDFGAAPADFQVTELAGRDYFEHASLQAASRVSIPWTAPARGTGELTVYAAANAVNGANGTSGDAVDEATLLIREDLSSSTNELREELDWQARRLDASTLLVTPPSGLPLHGGGTPYTATVYSLAGVPIARAALRYAPTRIALGSSPTRSVVVSLERGGRVRASRLVTH